MMGTPDFMAPEFWLGNPYDGEKVDVFALGVILFMLGTGVSPF